MYQIKKNHRYYLDEFKTLFKNKKLQETLKNHNNNADDTDDDYGVAYNKKFFPEDLSQLIPNLMLDHLA